MRSDDLYASRVVKDILPKEANTLVQLRNFAYDETIEEMQRMRKSAPPSRENRFGKLPAGYVKKKAEKKQEVEKELKFKASLKIAGNQKTEEDQPHVDLKTDIELQMEYEKSRQWIRKKNGRIYDEKIKNMILTSDNGS